MKTLIIMLTLAVWYGCSPSRSAGYEEKETSASESIPRELSTQNRQPAAGQDQSSSDTLISRIIEMRQAQLAGQPGVEITGEVFFTRENFGIINFTENHQWEGAFPFTLVIRPANEIGHSLANEGDRYAEISRLLDSALTIPFAALPGNFTGEKPPATQGAIPWPVILNNHQWSHTYLSGSATIWLLDSLNRLVPTAVTATSEADAGTCEGPVGVMETFEFSNDRQTVRVVRTEGQVEGFGQCDTYRETKSYREYRWQPGSMSYMPADSLPE